MELEYNNNHGHALNEWPVAGKDLIGIPPYVTITASGNVKFLDPTEYSGTLNFDYDLLTHRIFRAGTVRVTFKAKRLTGAGNNRYKIFVDGVEVVDDGTGCSTSAYTTFTNDITVVAGSILYINNDNLYIKDFSIGFDRQLYG